VGQATSIAPAGIKPGPPILNNACHAARRTPAGYSSEGGRG